MAPVSVVETTMIVALPRLKCVTTQAETVITNIPFALVLLQFQLTWITVIN
jgi:hypothetical protein